MTAATAWQPFFTSAATVLAALVGLIFVAVSINLDHILTVPGLHFRVMEALGVLVGSLLLSLLVLIPYQPRVAFAGEALAIAVTVTVLTALATKSMFSVRKMYPKRFAFSVLVAVVTLSPYFLSATGGPGWIGAAIVLSIVSATLDSWLLLIGINLDRPHPAARHAPRPK